MTTTDEATPTTLSLDEEAVAVFGDQILASYTGAFVTYLIDLGLRAGLFEAAAAGPPTSRELAERAGLEERYVREWLGAVATAGIVTSRRGGGVPCNAYRPELTDVMAERLAAGVRVADIGCGTGHTTNLLARAFPNSTFVGHGLADDAIARGTAEAAGYGLSNVTFEVADVTRLPADPPLDVAFAFDAADDQADPAGVLARVFDALLPGGMLVMFDIRASSHLERNLDNPMAPWLYAVSTLHCMPVSLAAGGAGLGTVWGEELALQMLTDAGFVGLEVHDVPGDPLDSVYVARKPE